MQNGDEAFVTSIILASQGLLVKMLLNHTIYFDQILHNFFKLVGKMTKKNICHAWIRTTVRQVV